MGWHGAPHLKGISYRGIGTYAVTCCTFDRHPWFLDDRVAQCAITQLMTCGGHAGFEILAYCVMPDHVHVLMEGQSMESDLLRYVDNWKQRTGFAHRRRTGFKLWQAGYWERVLRSDEDLVRIATYIVANPVRARIVSDVADFPHWGSQRWTRQEMLAAVQHARNG